MLLHAPFGAFAARFGAFRCADCAERRLRQPTATHQRSVQAFLSTVTALLGTFNVCTLPRRA
eukprot:7592670-Alexandrium_andersonii.AAC.1